MKAVSIQQPWASAIIKGIKVVENRTWYTDHRGDLVIHASSTLWRHKIPSDELKKLEPLGRFDCLPTGVLLGVVNLLGCQPISSSEPLQNTWFAYGPICWILDNPREFKQPVNWRGMPGLFDVPYEVVWNAANLQLIPDIFEDNERPIN